jgi:HK97 family phage major capsid protein/HK97 family phage prohead protease
MLVHKTLARAGEGLEFVLSDDTVDSYGDIIDPKGWDLKNFKRNPIALFGHSSGNPIGTWKDVRVEGGKLIGKLVFAAKGTSARIDELISLVEQGILRAVSVGFMPIKSQPIDPEKPYGPQKFIKQELREVSLVSVPANPAALAVAKSLNVSSETMSLAFGEHAETRRRDFTTHGEKAVSTPQRKEPGIMKTLAQRIEDAQNEFNLKRDALATLTQADEIDNDAIEELTVQVETAERTLANLKAAETRIGVAAAAKPPAIGAPAIARMPLGYKQKEVNGFDLFVRAAVANGLAFCAQKDVDKILDERYPGHEATAYMAKANTNLVTKADQTIGTTTVSGWASEIVQTGWADFLQALMPYSVYPALRARGVGLSFDGQGTVRIPRRTAGGAGGGFVAEGSPIRVGRITTADTSMSPKKLGVIVPFSRELAKRSTPSIEALVRQSILEDTAVVLDAALLDATASSTARPAGLLNGVSAVGTGTAGADAAAVIADLKLLLAPFYTANAADNITLIMHPSQALSLSLMPGAKSADYNWASGVFSRMTVIESTNATANRLIAIRNSDFCTALGDAPEFMVSEEATVHMEDTTPLEIVAGTPTTADPVRSFFQTGTIGVRMMMDVAWIMRRTGVVQFLNTTTW